MLWLLGKGGGVVGGRGAHLPPLNVCASTYQMMKNYILKNIRLYKLWKFDHPNVLEKLWLSYVFSHNFLYHIRSEFLRFCHTYQPTIVIDKYPLQILVHTRFTNWKNLNILSTFVKVFEIILQVIKFNIIGALKFLKKINVIFMFYLLTIKHNLYGWLKIKEFNEIFERIIYQLLDLTRSCKPPHPFFTYI